MPDSVTGMRGLVSDVVPPPPTSPVKGEDRQQDAVVNALQRSGEFLVTVDLAPVADTHDQNDHFAIFYPGNDPVVPQAILPKFPETGTLKGLTDAARIIKRCDTFKQELQYASGDLGIELA